MYTYHFTFNFRNRIYSATVQIIHPHYQCNFEDEALRKEYGTVNFVWGGRGFSGGVLVVSTEDLEFIHSLRSAVQEVLEANNMMPRTLA